ncbi:MAG: site-specific integrase [Veillonellales bacterium]
MDTGLRINDSSCRRITLPTSIVVLLKEYKSQQNAVRLELGDKWQDHDRLFTQWNGKPMYTQTPSQWFSKFLKRHNLPHVPFKGLRHTSASLLIAQGVPLKNVSTRLGHTDIRTTANIYSHSLQSVDQQIADSMDTFLTQHREKSETKKG